MPRDASGAEAIVAQAVDEFEFEPEQSPVMRQLFEKAKRVATRDTTVLITGETGVGKERLARWIHVQSRRGQRAFVAVNCGALPDTLLDTHLFGHVKGSFTGASGDAAGLFEAASGGTLFLDEVGEVSPTMQVKLLRVLEEREVQRVGEWRTRPVDVRVLAATNRSLDEEVAAGRFRDDLLYRLRVVELRVPPLRERLGELSRLAHDFLVRKGVGHASGITGFSPDAWASLLQYRWPGNVRELLNVIETAVTNADGTTVELVDLPERIRSGTQVQTGPGARQASGRPLDQLQRSYILGVLRRHGGNQRLAAAELGISLSTLKRRLRV
jgi:transcriptional regulator with PAS, ATPase and Fis domain